MSKSTGSGSGSGSKDRSGLLVGYVSSLSTSGGLNFDESGPSKGDEVKKKGLVLKTLAEKLERQPNISCRVESFGRMCATFDKMRRNWVIDMGFGGLLHLQDKQLPRGLCYWLMSRIHPGNMTLNTCDDKSYTLSKNQVNWVLGIPKGETRIPTKPCDEEMSAALDELNKKYGREWEITKKKNKKVFKCRGIHISSKMIDRAEGSWEVNEEEEFKTLFLLLALHMVLCPTQGSMLGNDLGVAACLARKARQYDWCSLVLQKMRKSVESFAKRFYADGYAGGCGGCTIFVAVLYLDRLKRIPVQWGGSPRIRVWTMDEIRKASSEDRIQKKGDYGKLGCLDVAYGEDHPLESRDKEAPPCDEEKDREWDCSTGGTSKPRRRGPDRGYLAKARKRQKIVKTGELLLNKVGGEDEANNLGGQGEFSLIPHDEHASKPS